MLECGSTRCMAPTRWLRPAACSILCILWALSGITKGFTFTWMDAIVSTSKLCPCYINSCSGPSEDQWSEQTLEAVLGWLGREFCSPTCLEGGLQQGTCEICPLGLTRGGRQEPSSYITKWSLDWGHLAGQLVDNLRRTPLLLNY